MVEDFATLKKSPLKPQQKLYFLRNRLLPKYYHLLVLSKVYAGHLKKIDLKVRRFEWENLNFQHDIPSTAFHALMRDGGMGLPCMRWIVRFMVLRRLCADRERILRLLTASDGRRLTSIARVDSFFKRELHSRSDGADLQQCSACLLHRLD